MRFDCYMNQGDDLLNRYAGLENELVVSTWVRLFEEFEFPGEGWSDRARFLLNSQDSDLRHAPAVPKTTTVFISHRSTDKTEAIHAANILGGRGIDYWLDIEDPVLAALGRDHGLPGGQVALLTALVIEIALLNSTHVLALITTKTKGSMWVPYEYGRVKKSRLFAQEAASLSPPSYILPEYMLLGTCMRDTNDLQTWP